MASYDGAGTIGVVSSRRPALIRRTNFGELSPYWVTPSGVLGHPQRITYPGRGDGIISVRDANPSILVNLTRSTTSSTGEIKWNILVVFSLGSAVPKPHAVMELLQVQQTQRVSISFHPILLAVDCAIDTSTSSNMRRVLSGL